MDVVKRYLLILLIVHWAQTTGAQSLNGKVIYVSPSQVVMLRFRSAISNASFASKDAENLFEKRIIGDKNFSINSINTEFKPAKLFIVEGENTHLFILRYKENFEKAESLYDFSSKSKLKKEAENLQNNESSEADTAQTTATPATNGINDQASKIKPDNQPTQKEIDERFADLKTKANKAYSSNSYDEAKELYTAALLLKPNDPWCTGQLNDIENKKAAGRRADQQKAADQLYHRHISAADSAFSKKSYDLAKLEYNLASKEKPDLAYPAAQLKKVDQAQKNDAYEAYMRTGRDAFTAQAYDKADTAFKEAMKIKPNDAEARRELGKVNTAKTALSKKQQESSQQAELQKQYNDTVSKADDMYSAGMYSEAKRKYSKAAKMMAGQLYPAKQIASIDSILARQKTDIGKRKQDSLNMVKYSMEVEKGNKALESKDFPKAKASFQLAQSIRPEEKYPVERLSAIEVMLLQANGEKKAEAARKALQDSINKQYTLTVKRGTAAITKNDYKAAKTFFTQALELKPGETAPVAQLELVNRKLAEIAINERYDELIHTADSIAFTAHNYNASLRWFDSARVLKPAESYPKKQIVAVNQTIFKRDSMLVEQENEKLRTGKFNQVIGIYRKADTARLDRKYQDAYRGFSEFLSRVDQADMNKYSSTQQYYITQAKDFLNRLQAYKPDPVADSIQHARIVDSLNNLNPGKKKKKKGKATVAYISPAPDAASGLQHAVAGMVLYTTKRYSYHKRSVEPWLQRNDA